MKEIDAHKLIGRKILDSEGKKVGRIHEISVERGEQSCPVEAYYIGGRAMLLRIASWALPFRFSNPLQSKLSRPLRISWEQMDLSDPEHPRTTVPKDALGTAASK
ncbi:MAG: PRC-barrel domain-containing protein [Gemmatimonadaceae bacterium]